MHIGDRRSLICLLGTEKEVLLKHFLFPLIVRPFIEGQVNRSTIRIIHAHSLTFVAARPG